MASNKDVKKRLKRHTSAPGFAREAARQSALVAATDATDDALMAFMDDALIDLEDER